MNLAIITIRHSTAHEAKQAQGVNMLQYKLLGGGEIYKTKKQAIEQARFYAHIVGYKPEIRVIKDGVVQFESVPYSLY